MTSLINIWNNIVAIFGSADMITLAIIIVIVLTAGIIMQRFESLVTVTVIALLLFSLAGYVRAVVVNGKNAAQLADSLWHGFLGMTMQSFLPYAIAFAGGIGLIYLVRAIMAR